MTKETEKHEPIGADGLELKEQIRREKGDKKTESFDPGASMLGTDNEAGSGPDHEGMAQARNAPPPE